VESHAGAGGSRDINPPDESGIRAAGVRDGVSSGRTRRQVLAATAALAGTAGCLGGRERPPSAGSDAADATVRLSPPDGFVPETVRVAVGGVVEWVHEGDRPHTVTAYEDRLPPGADYFATADVEREVTARVLYPVLGSLARGDRYRHGFETPGTYHYFSIPVESAWGTARVVVG
jgi:plastocyanin